MRDLDLLEFVIIVRSAVFSIFSGVGGGLNSVSAFYFMICNSLIIVFILQSIALYAYIV